MLCQRTWMFWLVADVSVVFMMVGCVFSAVAAEPTVDSPTVDETGIYARKSSLRETLSATRVNLEAWSAEQAAVRKQVKLTPWMVAVMPSVEAAKTAAGKPIDPDAKGTDGKPLWKPRPDLVDGRSNNPRVPRTPAVLLTRTIKTPKPLTLSIGIGGGDHIDIWLNGERCLSKPTRRRRQRYGCGAVIETSIADQVISSLKLKAGENRLVVQLTPGHDRPFYFSTAPDPVPGFWRQIRSEFPAVTNPLLETAKFQWFEPKGWFATKDIAHEKYYIKTTSKAMDESGRKIASELAKLKQDKAGRTDPRWLALCVKTAALDKLHREMKSLRGAVDELGSLFPEKYPHAELSKRLDNFTSRLAALAGCELDRIDEAADPLLAEMLHMKREMLVKRNPFLKDSELLFVKRYTYNSMHYYDDFQHISRWGGNLCVLSLADGRVREVAKQLDGGVFDRYDLSFDGRRIVFGYRRPKPEGFRIHEIGVDGSGLRQVTFVPDDERERMTRFGHSTHKHTYGIGGYGFWTDDVHPCYLPDGGICFASTRPEQSVICASSHYLATTNLYRVEPDGSRIQRLSYGALSEFTPTVMEDGRILYNRWEYVYKGIAGVQPLWMMRPDGSASNEFFGNSVTDPGVLWQGRQVPGHPNLVACIGCGHEPFGVGSAQLIDVSEGRRTVEAMRSLTPDVRTQGIKGIYHLRNGRWREDWYGPLYADPYPLSDKFFLVACNESKRYNDQAGYGIFLLDTFGNRVPVYCDEKISCWQPMVLAPRPAPPVIPTIAKTGTKDADTAKVFLSDVYRGLSGVPRGTVKYVRVMEQIPRHWSSEINRPEDRGPGHIPAVSLGTHIWIGVMLGVVPVNEDGSASFEVPANRNLYFQALDEDYMQVQGMRTFVNLVPGETRSCVGCHEPRAQTPASRGMLSPLATTVSLSPQPGDLGARPLYYPADVQPMLDRHCVSCHNAKDPQGKLDLSGGLTTLFNRSYEEIIRKRLINGIREWVPLPKGGLPGGSMSHVVSTPPYTYGSHRSKLIELLRKGHYDVKLDREEFIRLVTWIDTNGQYYGSYFGRRNLKFLKDPDFRPVPTLEMARSARSDIDRSGKPKAESGGR